MFLHNLLNVLVQIANKMGFQKINYEIVAGNDVRTEVEDMLESVARRHK
jgi:hypothetical protein